MKISDYIDSIIIRLPKGFVFTSNNFGSEVSKEAVVKTLNRMVESGKLQKISKGRFYKPETSVFGELEPPKEQIVKDLLFDDGKLTGYLTGLSIYNEIGLTSQISNTIQIGKNEIRPTFTRGKYTISFVKQKNTINKENIPLLQILDTIKSIKRIPDSTLSQSAKKITEIVANLNEFEVSKIIKLSLKYPPSTRALLGAILEFKNIAETESLKNSLNSITTYSYPGVEAILPTSKNWNIK
ncbi:hypothetical protein EIH07_05465 [Chryseobacterium taklimakanense]|uniref:DUF6088 family protein n=1 Tax=Chryseobacterium taklimakanense TaxID=536441 RepID=UPI000F5E09BF|nr:DUF6088 family protein [Chryseobacterium taklimakanense]AZI22531.1 hypothetical protein EIH07_05465 [Chryseobacterium taklimakanense]